MILLFFMISFLAKPDLFTYSALLPVPFSTSYRQKDSKKKVYG
ncbi:hypothetical protein BLGI_3894 [Brevibacillus laterosporus GI-9]|nr:hypothetical protein BLGI_3894 [Brevibacillus laterosporus GI-9]